MKRNYQAYDFKIATSELQERIAYHEAGHATAIYLYNQQQQLPPIFFQITLNNKTQLLTDALEFARDSVAAKVEGGFLIQNLALSFIDSQYYMTGHEQASYYAALDADIVNLLAGSIAEAYYVSLRDNEMINAQMLRMSSLQHYGSSSDLEKIEEYLAYATTHPEQQLQKFAQLVEQAFDFISHPKTWKAVQAVADFILKNPKQTMSCEEIFSLIDNSVTC